MSCTLPPGSATALRTLPLFEHCDESKHCLQRLEPGAGTKDAPRASSLKLRGATRGFGLRPTSYDGEFETSSNLLTAKPVNDINMAGTEDTIDKCVKRGEDGSVILDPDEYIKQLRPVQHPELPGADADVQAFKMVADMFVSLRGALAHALITQAWLMVHAVSLQRVQEPTNIQVRRLNAITRKLQACRKKIVYQAMTARAMLTCTATQVTDA
eukprot:4939865-Pyramimonas_sp.AAC.1